MNPRRRVLLGAVVLIAGASQVRADFDPFEASRNAVRNYGLESRVENARMLCTADLVHWGGFAADYVTSIVDPKTRSTVENICTLIYAERRLVAVSLAYALLATPAAHAVKGLEKALEVLIELPAKD